MGSSGGQSTGIITGCCGWTEAQARYVQDFSVIELQTTFYQPPASAVAKRWKAIAPTDFRFCMKAWQLITHTPSSPTYRRLKSPVSPEEQDLFGSFRPTEQVALAWERTREIAAILDAQVIVFQCPKSFLPTRENIRNLSTFFAGIDRDSRGPCMGAQRPGLVSATGAPHLRGSQSHPLRGPVCHCPRPRRHSLLAASWQNRVSLSVHS